MRFTSCTVAVVVSACVIRLGRSSVARLGQVGHVARPVQAVLAAVAGLGVVRGLDPLGRRRQLALGPEPCYDSFGGAAPLVVSLPDRAEHVHLRRPAEFGRGLGRVQPVEQQEPVSADRLGIGLTLLALVRKAGVLDPATIPLVPFRGGHTAHPFGSDRG